MTDIVESQTIGQIWDIVRDANPNLPFLIFENQNGLRGEWTYAEFDKRIVQTADFLYRAGVRKGAMVATHMRNCPEFLAIWMAAEKLGAVLIPISYQNSYRECAHIFSTCKVALAVVDDEFTGIYAGAVDEGAHNLPRLYVMGTFNPPKGFVRFDLNKDAEMPETAEASSGDLAEILFTSGTTSNPKGVMITHYNCIYAGIYHAWQCGLEPGERFLTSMPNCHIDFQLMAVMSVLAVGGTLVMIEHYSARVFWKQICKYQANVSDTMPLMIHTLLGQPVRPWEKEHKLHHVYFSMGMCDAEKERFETRFGVRLLNCYGMTETICCNTGSPLFGDRRWPSVGRAGFGYGIEIRDDAGAALPPDEVGEICVHGIPGRTLFLGYYGDEKHTKEIMDDDGWLHTGDKGYLSRDGWLYFVDRRANMIKRSGENISSLEVENVLISHPCVAEAAVIGVPDPMRNQAVKAFVSLVDGAAVSEEDILCYCGRNLATYKVPSYLEIVSDFPRTCNGKIQKRKLEEGQTQR